jgi:hypothetical protein
LQYLPNLRVGLDAGDWAALLRCAVGSHPVPTSLHMTRE